MLKGLVRIIYIIITILTFVYLIKVYNDTKTDPLQDNLDVEEKKKFFKYIAQYEEEMNTFEIKCKKYQDFILESEITKLGDIFHLNIWTIHFCSYIIIFIFIFHISLTLLVPCLKECAKATNDLIIGLLFSSLRDINLGLPTANFVIIIFMINSFYNGDINTYYDFISCDNVNYDKFEKYRSVENLKINFWMFMCLQIVLFCLDWAFPNFFESD